MADASEREKPRRFGGYEVLRQIGRSGGAFVYRARQVSVDRLVTLTILPRQEAEKPAYRQRFERQVAAASKLRHPNVLSAIDAGSIAGHQYIVSEHVGGRRLSEALEAKEWFGIRRAVHIALGLARALEHVDSVGMLHRNLTPQTVILGDADVVKLRGFSFSRPHRNAASETWFDVDDDVTAYRAPDWVNEKTVDVRADLYSLGCILFHMLTGRAPYGGGNAATVLERHVKSPIPDPRVLRKDIPEDLAAVVERLLAKDREERYPDAGALVADLEAIEAGESIAAPPKLRTRRLFRRR